MQAYRPDRVVRLLTTLVSIAYFTLWAVAALALIAGPAAKLLAGSHPEWTFGLKVPATLLDTEATVRTGWGRARLVVADVRGDLQLPIAMLPWWLVAVLWAHAAVAFALVLLFLHQLRRIFQRVRDGAPFDAHNALRIRHLGLLLLAFALFSGVAEFITSLAVGSALTSGNIAVARWPHINLTVVFVALVLVSLAEIFRRGADLENEQSLVI